MNGSVNMDPSEQDIKKAKTIATVFRTDLKNAITALREAMIGIAEDIAPGNKKELLEDHKLSLKAIKAELIVRLVLAESMDPMSDLIGEFFSLMPNDIRAEGILVMMMSAYQSNKRNEQLQSIVELVSKMTGMDKDDVARMTGMLREGSSNDAFKSFMDAAKNKGKKDEGL